jgi:hypothetical protein
MGNPAQRGKRDPAAILNQNPFFEIASSIVYPKLKEVCCMEVSGFRILAIIMLLAFVALLNGCATMDDVVQVKEAGTEGTTKVYPVNADQAWEISKTVFRWEGADAIEEHRDEDYMLTSSGPNLVSWGAVMGAWIEPVDKEIKRDNPFHITNQINGEHIFRWYLMFCEVWSLHIISISQFGISQINQCHHIIHNFFNHAQEAIRLR